MQDVKLKIEGVKKKEKEAELTKLSDNEAEVKEISGRKDGKSGKKKKKGRINEVRYMDDCVESDDENEQMKSQDNDEFVGQKKKEGNWMEESDDGKEDETNEIEDKDSTIHKIIGKKRNKGKSMNNGVLGELNRDKPAKKKAKAEKMEGGKLTTKDGLAGRKMSDGKKGKNKSELDRRSGERIAKVKDVIEKKGLSAK